MHYLAVKILLEVQDNIVVIKEVQQLKLSLKFKRLLIILVKIKKYYIFTFLTKS